MNVAIIGCGLMGQKRAKALGLDCTFSVACDKRYPGTAFPAADKFYRDWRQVVGLPFIDAVIISTPHNMLADIAFEAVRAGKHVLIEKPGAMRADELKPVKDVAEILTDVQVRVGFNHRYHRAMCKAREIVDSGAIGQLMYIRGRYGHGGRPGMENEWRCDPEQSGGGELIDQGVHLIDLARWFLGDFTKVQGLATRCYWQSPVDDNAFLLLGTERGQTAHLHASWTEWKNTFSFEITGTRGKVEISGLGGSYGVERCTLYQMLPQMGPPETTTWEYPMADDSFEFEWAEFMQDIRLKRTPVPGIADAQAALRIVERMYAGK